LLRGACHRARIRETGELIELICPTAKAKICPSGYFAAATVAIKTGTLNSDGSADCRFATHSGTRA